MTSGLARICRLASVGWAVVATTACPPSRSLTVTVAGSGTVKSVPAGVDCTASCVAHFPEGTTVNLAATEGAQSVFVGWSGDCAGGAACHLVMAADRAATAGFAPRNLVRGRLVHEEPGSGQFRPAASASVRLLGTTLGVIADENGDFLFPDVPAGTHTLHARFASLELLVRDLVVAFHPTSDGAPRAPATIWARRSSPRPRWSRAR